MEFILCMILASILTGGRIGVDLFSVAKGNPAPHVEKARIRAEQERERMAVKAARREARNRPADGKPRLRDVVAVYWGDAMADAIASHNQRRAEKQAQRAEQAKAVMDGREPLAVRPPLKQRVKRLGKLLWEPVGVTKDDQQPGPAFDQYEDDPFPVMWGDNKEKEAARRATAEHDGRPRNTIPATTPPSNHATSRPSSTTSPTPTPQPPPQNSGCRWPTGNGRTCKAETEWDLLYCDEHLEAVKAEGSRRCMVPDPSHGHGVCGLLARPGTNFCAHHQDSDAQVEALAADDPRWACPYPTDDGPCGAQPRWFDRYCSSHQTSAEDAASEAPSNATEGEPMTTVPTQAAPTGEAVNYETAMAELDAIEEAQQAHLDQALLALEKTRETKQAIADSQASYRPTAEAVGNVHQSLTSLNLDQETVANTGTIADAMPPNAVDAMFEQLEQMEAAIAEQVGNAETALATTRLTRQTLLEKYGDAHVTVQGELGGDSRFLSGSGAAA